MTCQPPTLLLITRRWSVRRMPRRPIRSAFAPSTARASCPGGREERPRRNFQTSFGVLYERPGTIACRPIFSNGIEPARLYSSFLGGLHGVDGTHVMVCVPSQGIETHVVPRYRTRVPIPRFSDLRTTACR